MVFCGGGKCCRADCCRSGSGSASGDGGRSRRQGRRRRIRPAFPLKLSHANVLFLKDRDIDIGDFCRGSGRGREGADEGLAEAFVESRSSWQGNEVVDYV